MTRFFFLPVVVCLWAFAVNAQTADKPINPKSPYGRLLETQKEYEAAMKKGDSLEVAEMCYIMGKRYIGLKDYTKAQQWFLRALRIREPLGLSEDIGKIYIQMTGFPVHSPLSATALHYQYVAYLNFRAGKSLRSQMEANKLLSHFHVDTWKLGRPLPYSTSIGSLDSAVYYAERYLKAAKMLNSPLDVGDAYGFLSGLWKLKNNPHKSSEYRQKALEVYTKAKLVNNIMGLYMGIGEDWLKQNKPSLAKPWLDKASALSGSVSDHTLDELLTKVYGLYYEQTGQWDKAFRYQKKNLEMKTREFDIQLSQVVQNLILLDEYEKKKVQFAAQQKEMALQKKLSIVIAFMFLGAALSGFLFYLLFAKYRKISQHNALLVREQSHRTKNNLQSVFDLLNLQLYQLTDPIAVKALEESLMRVEAMLLVHQRLYQGSKLMEVNLQKYLPDLIKSVLRSYHLEATDLVYKIDPIWLHTDKAIPLGLIVNELTTNACKYALTDNPRPVLKTSCFLKGGKVMLHFSDNGPGFVPHPLQDSFGLNLIGMLTDQLNADGKFSKNKGCCFALSFEHKITPVVDKGEQTLENQLT
jgi:two-component system, sensor histidine kinase PdtaS